MVSFLAKKAGAHRFIIDGACVQPTFSEPPSGRTLTGEGKGTLPCQISGSARGRSVPVCGFSGHQERVSSNAHSWMVASVFFALPAVLASEVGYNGKKTVSQKRFAPDSLIYRDTTTLLMGFSWAMFFCQDVTDHCTLLGRADYPLFVCRDHSTPRCLGSKYGMGSGGFRC